jgi:hypothetical protein
MKTATTTLLSLLFALNLVCAQNKGDLSKEKIAAFPNTMSIAKTALQDAFKFEAGQKIQITFNNNFVFSGQVISNELKYADLRSMIIKSDEDPSALLQISRIVGKDHVVSYTGRIMNQKALEVIEIKKDLADHYSLRKIGLDKILQDCSY